jgi:two-component system cell cycle sensor histidine kinase/response regulator CckA
MPLDLANQAIESSINGIVFTDLRGQLNYANLSFLRMWGYKDSGEALPHHLSSFVETHEAVDTILARVLQGDAWVGELAARKKAGQRFVTKMSATLVRDAAGAPVAIMASFVDVSAQRSADPRVREAHRAGVSQVVETGHMLRDIAEMQSRPFGLGALAPAGRDVDGRLKASETAVQDSTSRTQIEQALRESEERLRLAVGVSHIGIFDHNHLTDTVYWSPEHREIFGWGADEPVTFHPVSGNSRHMFDLIHPDDRPRVIAAVQRAHQAEHGSFDIDYRIVRRNGEVRWVASRSHTFFEGQRSARRPARTVGAVRDITAQKNAEQERILLLSQLGQAQKMESVGRLAGGVAHDFNNMLSVILGNLEFALKRADTSQPIYAELQQAHNAAQRSTDLTRQLLAFARKQDAMPKVLNLNDVVAGSLNILRRLIGENIDLVWRPGHNLGSVKIDPTQVDQILTNLSANARDAISGVGQIVIRTENVVLDDRPRVPLDGPPPGTYAVLEVTDDGHGMDVETQAHVFEPFYTTKREGEGTGLGLASVYGIVRQNDGFVAVSSEVGRGTTVKIFLPRVEAEVGRTGPERTAEPPKGTETVLVVEDEPMVLRLSKTLLQRLGYEVLAASTPGEAVHLVAQHAGTIHLLLTDVVMPEMNGKELAERLVTLRPALKCLFVSGYPADAITLRGVLNSGVHFLQKPFSSTELAAKVREVLET